MGLARLGLPWRRRTRLGPLRWTDDTRLVCGSLRSDAFVRLGSTVSPHHTPSYLLTLIKSHLPSLLLRAIRSLFAQVSKCVRQSVGTMGGYRDTVCKV